MIIMVPTVESQEEKEIQFLARDKKYPVQVTSWVVSRDEIEFAANDFKRQGVRFGIAKRCGSYSIWRELLPGDSRDLLQAYYPELFIEKH